MSNKCRICSLISCHGFTFLQVLLFVFYLSSEYVPVPVVRFFLSFCKYGALHVDIWMYCDKQQLFYTCHEVCRVHRSSHWYSQLSRSHSLFLSPYWGNGRIGRMNQQWNCTFLQYVQYQNHILELLISSVLILANLYRWCKLDFYDQFEGWN